MLTRTKGMKIFAVFNAVLMLILTLACLLPFIHVLAVSFSDAASAGANKVLFLPIGFNTLSYELVFENAYFLRAFGVSVLRTGIGTVLNLTMCVLTAYPLSKENRDLKGRGVLIAFFAVPMLISGGLIPTFMLIKNLNLLDNFLVLIVPGCVPVFYVIMMMNFFRGINRSLWESAAIDGASEWTVLTKIFLPLSKASLATIALFASVDHWNEWFGGLIYMNDQRNWPLQTLLRQMLQAIDSSMLTPENLLKLKFLSNRSFQAAQIIFATVPILLVYPFLQRHFVSGVVIGAVKE